MPPRNLVVAVGGLPVAGTVRAEHCAHVADLMSNLHSSGIEVRPYYQATWTSRTMVARANMIDRAITQGVDVLICIESDVWGPLAAARTNELYRAAITLMISASLADDRETRLRYVEEEEDSIIDKMFPLRDVALIGLSVARHENAVDVWRSPTHRMLETDWTSPIGRVFAVGGGYNMYNLNWYRRNLETARRFESYMTSSNEHYNHCVAVNAAGGVVLAAYADTFCRPWGEDSTYAVSPKLAA